MHQVEALDLTEPLQPDGAWLLTWPVLDVIAIHVRIQRLRNPQMASHGPSDRAAQIRDLSHGQALPVHQIPFGVSRSGN